MAKKASKSNALEIILGGILFILILTIKGIGTAVHAILAWEKYAFPAKQVAAYYYFGLILPFQLMKKGFYLTWVKICDGPATPYSRINVLIAIVLIACEIVILLQVVAFTLRLCFRILGRAKMPFLLLIFLGPVSFWLGWCTVVWFTAK